MPNATIEVINDLTQSSWSVNLDEDMIRFLRQPTMKGASRLDAYFYLLKKCLNTPTTTKPVFEDEIKLEPYQIVVVITELAEKWNWSRETVRKFLDRLENFGLLKKRQLDRCSVLTMNVTCIDKELNQMLSTMKLRPEISEYIDKWEDGEIDDYELEDKLDYLFANVYSKEHVGPSVMACGLTAQTLILWIKRIVVNESGHEFDISPAAYHFLMPMVKCVFFDMLDRSWVQWCIFVHLLEVGARSYHSTNPTMSGDDILLHMSQTITEAIILQRSGQCPFDNASREAPESDIDGEDMTSAEKNENVHKSR